LDEFINSTWRTPTECGEKTLTHPPPTLGVAPQVLPTSLSEFGQAETRRQPVGHAGTSA